MSRHCEVSEYCEICKITRGKEVGLHDKKYLVQLDGGWVLNHYARPAESYLGYLVLSTEKHRPYFYCLSDDELTTLGLNIK